MTLLQINFVEWLKHHLFACPFKTYFGIDCPGCGFQRSIIALLQGDLMTSVKLYPAAIPLVFVVLFKILHLRYPFKFGAAVIKVAFLSVVTVILINYIYKIYTHQLI